LLLAYDLKTLRRVKIYTRPIRLASIRDFKTFPYEADPTNPTVISKF
jgi:hypothetical protein